MTKCGKSFELRMKPKILFIMHMPPPVHGASMVGKYIHDSELVNTEFECMYLNPTTARSLDDVNKFRFGKVFDVFKLRKRIKSAVREFNPDLVYFTANAAGMSFYKDFIIVKALKGLGCKVVVHYHNKGVATRQDRWLDNLLYERFFKDLKVVMLAENLYADIKKYVKYEDVQICGNGIPDAHVCHQKSTPHDNTISLLYLSNMMKEKGVWVLLDACAELKKRGISFLCNFVGGWKDISAEDFKICVDRLGIGDCVSAHGAKYGDEKLPFFAYSDVMVFPTFYHNECFPLVLLEGMMHGLACVSTDEAGIPGIIDGIETPNPTGVLVTKKDAIALADAIEVLATDPELCRRMGTNGREKYEREFTLSAFEKRFVNCLKLLLVKKDS